jgi:hypothetical protein
VRLRLEASYPKGETTAHVAQWYWHGSGDSWSEQRSVTVPIRSDGLPHVYWTYLPVAQVGDITGLRFDPVDGQISSSVQWIAVDLVK